MSSETFYTVTSSVSFLLLGFWWMVVQGKPAWRLHPARRRMAYLGSLHYVLPGTMSILSLAAPDANLIWRGAFLLAGAVGVGAVWTIVGTLREEYLAPRLVIAYQWVVAPLYALVAFVAVVPDVVRTAGLALTPLQVESVVLCLILFLGVQTSWFLAMEPQRSDGDGPPATDR
jgi:hypothetical protein